VELRSLTSKIDSHVSGRRHFETVLDLGESSGLSGNSRLIISDIFIKAGKVK